MKIQYLLLTTSMTWKVIVYNKFKSYRKYWNKTINEIESFKTITFKEKY